MLHYKTFENQSLSQWIVMIHGVGGSSSIWYKQLREYKKHYNLLLVDLRGHGKSQNLFFECFNDRYTFQDIANDVIEVMEHLNIKSAHFVGISLGSIIIRTISETVPEKVSSMILGGAITKLNFRSQILMWAADRVKKIVPFMWLYSFYAHILMPRRRHRESRSMFIKEAKKLARREILRWFSLTAQVNTTLKKHAKDNLLIPTLYIMGEEDYMFLPQVKMLIQTQSQAILKVLKSCGHVVNIDQPELFNQMSLDFMMKGNE